MSRQFHHLTIAAGGIMPIEQSEQCFSVAWSPSIIEIKWPGAGFGPYEQGDGEDLREHGGFKRLEIKNPNTTAIDVVIWIGPNPRVSQRAAIVEPPSEGKAVNIANLPLNSGHVLTGIATGNFFRRKAVILTNKDPNLDLEIRDKAGFVLVTVPPRQSHILNISGYVQMYNPNGSAVACNISEIWWTL